MQRLKLFGFALFLCVGLLGNSSQSMADEPVLRAGVYIIQMAGSDMTVAATSEADRSPMILWPYRPSATWAFTRVSSDVYTVRTNSTLLDGQAARAGSAVIIKRTNRSTSQKWKLKRVGQFYQFINAETGQAMELGNGKRVKGSRLVSNTPNESMDQLFCIQRASAPRFCGGGSGTESGVEGQGSQDYKGDQYHKGGNKGGKGEDKYYKKNKKPSYDEQYGSESEVNSIIRK